jgi:transcriptional regulator with PAS, ATPase and Fis domain
VQKALVKVQLRADVSRYQARDKARFRVDNLVGSSPPTDELRRLVRRISHSGARTILLCGETGTGKGLVARALHFESDHAHRPFLNITCTALPETLLESELFGHERGAFTDARVTKKGLLELAEGGTVFLDEVGDMPMKIQGKLLTFLEEKSFRRLGGTRDIVVDLGIVAATNRDLKEAVRDGSFRADLYYRLNVIPLEVPSLVRRKSDIPDLVRHFVTMFNGEFKKTVQGPDESAMQALLEYPWPGNIRELKNTIERAVLLSEDSVLTLDDLPFEIREGAAAVVPVAGRSTPFVLPRGGVNLEDVRKDLLVQALEQVTGNKTAAGKLLGLNRDQVRYWMRKYRVPDRVEAAS